MPGEVSRSFDFTLGGQSFLGWGWRGAVVCFRKRYPTLPHGEAVRRGWGTPVLFGSNKHTGFGLRGACVFFLRDCAFTWLMCSVSTIPVGTEISLKAKLLFRVQLQIGSTNAGDAMGTGARNRKSGAACGRLLQLEGNGCGVWVRRRSDGRSGRCGCPFRG